ncbi:5911_t:CDS:2, partial [Scutellospora calospora]
LIAEEAHEVLKRLQEGKKLCSDSSILMSEVWYCFQETFIESGLEVYQLRQLVEIPLIQKSDAEKNAEKSQQVMNELFERTKDQYY